MLLLLVPKANILLTTMLWISLSMHGKDSERTTCSQECKWACDNCMWVSEENAIWIIYLVYKFIAKLIFLCLLFWRSRKVNIIQDIKFLFICLAPLLPKCIFLKYWKLQCFLQFFLTIRVVSWIKTRKIIPMIYIIMWSDQHNFHVECWATSIYNKQHALKPQSERL